MDYWVSARSPCGDPYAAWRRTIRPGEPSRNARHSFVLDLQRDGSQQARRSLRFIPFTRETPAQKVQAAEGWRSYGNELWEAGRDVNGLFQHGLLPNVRDLVRVGGAYLHASDRELTLEQLEFVLKFVAAHPGLGS